MTINKSKGFTIIELLVVVAIIAVLAAIVLVNVTGYINQGKNAAIKGNMASMLTNGAVWYDGPGSGAYATGATAALSFLASNGFTAPSAAAVAALGSGSVTSAYDVATPAVATPASKWCACSGMKITANEPTGSTFCVDSSGYKKVTQNVGLCAARCNQATVGGQCID